MLRSDEIEETVLKLVIRLDFGLGFKTFMHRLIIFNYLYELVDTRIYFNISI